MTKPFDYKACGVDIDKGADLVRTVVKANVQGAGFEKGGLFGGITDCGVFSDIPHPQLVSSIDGVGTKTKLAAALSIHDTIGFDIVNHCADDLVVQGARPLFFLDYMGTSTLDREIFTAVIESLAKACKAAGCAFIGGETAEMPDLYPAGEYDLVGTMTGVVDKDALIDGSRIAEGDIIIGLPSSGLHTNGYTLARKIVAAKKLDLRATHKGMDMPLGEALLLPHVNYTHCVLELASAVDLKGLAHITGGGAEGNIQRVLPSDTNAAIDLSAYTVPTVFSLLKNAGSLETKDMLRVFNMGVGMACFVPSNQSRKALNLCTDYFPNAAIIGSVTQGKGKVIFHNKLSFN